MPIKLFVIVMLLPWHRSIAQESYLNNRLYLGISLLNTATSIASYSKNYKDDQAIMFNASLRYKVTNGFTLTPEYYHYQLHSKKYDLPGTSADHIQLKILKNRTFTDWFFIEAGGALGYSRSRLVWHYSARDGFDQTYHYMNKKSVSSLLVSYVFSVNFQYKRFVAKVELEPGIRFGPNFAGFTPYVLGRSNLDWPGFLTGDIELQYSLFHKK